MTDFYSKETDEDGKPIKHVQIPENAQTLIEALVEKSFEKMCIGSGIPRDPEARQDFFHWLRNFRKYGNKLIGLCLAAGAGGFFTLIVFLVKIYLEQEGK